MITNKQSLLITYESVNSYFINSGKLALEVLMINSLDGCSCEISLRFFAPLRIAEMRPFSSVKKSNITLVSPNDFEWIINALSVKCFN